ncbi:MAG TPA: VWA domain-containing protein [Pyrinomonadaceae bacterium]
MSDRNWGKHVGPALLVGVLALFFFLPVAAGQSLKDLPPPPPPPPTPKPTPTPEPKDEDFDVVRVSSNLVMVPVSVVDAQGEPVKGLQLPDFQLDESGKRQQIAQIGDPESVPLDIALLIDISGSTNAQFAFEKEAAAKFLRQVLKSEDRATLFLIDRVPVLKEASAGSDVAAGKLLSLQPAADKGPTAFFDTVVEAAKYLSGRPSSHRRVILVISDGADNFSERIKRTLGTTREEQDSIAPAVRERLYARSLNEVQREVQNADAVFYSINPSGETMHLNLITKRGQEGMAQVSGATGGTAFVPRRSEDLDKVFTQIAAELRGQYLLQYYSNSESSAGQFRPIKVAVPTHPQLRVRARQGYYPKGK